MSMSLWWAARALALKSSCRSWKPRHLFDPRSACDQRADTMTSSTMGKETMRLFIAPFALAAMTLAAPSIAQTAGMQVVDTTGGAVGTVVSVSGDNVVIKTDKHQVALPKTSF